MTNKGVGSNYHYLHVRAGFIPAQVIMHVTNNPHQVMRLNRNGQVIAIMPH